MTGITMSIDEYHSHPAIGKSTLDMIDRDPYSVQWAKYAPQNTDKLGAVNIGDAFHALLLEPTRFDATYAVMPPCDLRTKAGKEAAEQWRADNEGKRILTYDEGVMLQHMRASVMAHPQAQGLVCAGGEVEKSFFWTDPDTGIQCKCRPDILLPDMNLCVDVKTTADLRKFAYAVEDYRYHVQDAFYTDGLAHNGIMADMVFLVVQTTMSLGRYPVMVCMLPEEASMFGHQEYKRILREWLDFVNRPQDIDSEMSFRELKMHDRFINTCMDNLEVQL